MIELKWGYLESMPRKRRRTRWRRKPVAKKQHIKSF